MNLCLVHDVTEEQVSDLYQLYQEEWWTRGRKLEDIREMLKHSMVFAVLDQDNNKLIGFARVLTDFVYKALVLDVIANKSYRNTGIGKYLMDSICNHSSLRNVSHFELYCRPEMIPFYERWGFTNKLGELHFMRRQQ